MEKVTPTSDFEFTTEKIEVKSSEGNDERNGLGENLVEGRIQKAEASYMRICP